MKNKVLLIYGYIVPIVAAILVSFVPLFIKPTAYLQIVKIFQKDITLAFAIIAISIAVAHPFQSKVLTEDNKIINRGQQNY